MTVATKRPKTARPVRTNRGVEIKYRRKLQKLIDDMHASFDYWLRAAYKKYPPRMLGVVELATDASTHSEKINDVIAELAKRWIEKFEDSAPLIAEAYINAMYRATDASFLSALRDAGWTVNFQMTPAMRDALTASIEANVGLIKSIPVQYAQQVEGLVMRSYSVGRDLATLTSDLKALYPKAADRATLIARDQSNKAAAVVLRTRQLDLGITEAIWMHSHAGKTPRPDHVAANGKKYNIAQGCLISGEYIQPGEEINCRCTSRAVLPV